jgi:1-phosphofructokinase family hexose kinase
VILTVTLNAALDRTLTVPNFEVGFRHRATDTLSLPGGKGVNVARTIKTLGEPVIASGFLGGRTGDRILADLTREGILCDFVRIEQESRTSTAVLDPAMGATTEINEYGPEISPRELELMYEKLDYLSKAADVVVLAGSLPRGLEPGIYGNLLTFLHNAGAVTLFDTFGDPLRQGIKAGPRVVFPNQEEAEVIIGYEFSGDDDFLAAARGLREVGAGSAVIKSRQGCAAQVVDADGRVRSFIGKAPQVTAVSPVGSGDALVGGYAVALHRDMDPPECLRLALACSAANTLRAGAGVFYPEDVDRLAELVEIDEVEAG